MSQLDRRSHAYRPDLADIRLRGKVKTNRYIAGKEAQVARGVLDLHRAPESSAPLDSQLLFGESLVVFDEREGWAWVQNQSDGYVGYVAAAGLTRETSAPSHAVQVLRCHLYPRPDLKTLPLAALPLASRVTVVGRKGDYCAVALDGGKPGWVYARHIAPLNVVEPDYVATARHMIGLPYLWGGRSPEGLDCSALVQLALDRAGLAVPRDSDQQAAAIGELLSNDGQGSPLEYGDLVYFPGHVAIALDAEWVIHANASDMLVAEERLAPLVERVLAESGGRGITAVRRPKIAGVPAEGSLRALARP
jgi:cell wall-associated NlpC family hydrolase